MRAAYLVAAGSAASLLRTPSVAQRWTAPSALERLTVGGLAAHLGAQVLNVPRVLAVALPDGTSPISLPEHYDRVPWVRADLDAEVNVAVRTGSEASAAQGVDALLVAVDAALDALRAQLPAIRDDRAVLLPWTGWALTLDDFLLTRMMEIAVHADDLAVSVGVDTPALPHAVFGPVLGLLTDLAAVRHGQAGLLRALTRRERAGSVAVF
jgi:hypothetical protein